MVSPVSKRYMRAGIGNDRLVVCLSEYLPLRIVYRILHVHDRKVVCFSNI